MSVYKNQAGSLVLSLSPSEISIWNLEDLRRLRRPSFQQSSDLQGSVSPCGRMNHVWVNYNNSLTWIVRPLIMGISLYVSGQIIIIHWPELLGHLGMISRILTMIPGWGRTVRSWWNLPRSCGKPLGKNIRKDPENHNGWFPQENMRFLQLVDFPHLC